MGRPKLLASVPHVQHDSLDYRLFLVGDFKPLGPLSVARKQRLDEVAIQLLLCLRDEGQSRHFANSPGSEVVRND